MLAKEPRFLHRFYGSSSEMMHGNKDDQFPAVGQSKIREKIKSLNFKDCHTKVCLVPRLEPEMRNHWGSVLQF